MPTFGRGLLIVCVLAVAAFAAVAQAGGLGANPANHPKLIDKPIDDFSYDRARRCRPEARPGAEALARWIERNTRGELWGIYRCEKWAGTQPRSTPRVARSTTAWMPECPRNAGRRCG
jgi:hypothetical protein